jgi:hypothetical protein
MFDLADVVEAEEEGNDAEDAEAAVDETPIGRYTPDGSGDEGERDHPGARNDSELEDPFVADGINERADESNGDDEMGEGEPVGTVGHEWVGLVGVDYAIVDSAKPGVQGGFAGGWWGLGHVEYSIEDRSLVLEGKCGDAAEDQSHDEENEPESNAPDEALCVGGGHAPV